MLRLASIMFVVFLAYGCKKEVVVEKETKQSVGPMLFKKWKVDAILGADSYNHHDSIWIISPGSLMIQLHKGTAPPQYIYTSRPFEVSYDSTRFSIWYLMYYDDDNVPQWYKPEYFINYLSNDSMAASSPFSELDYRFTAVE
jgi:hypothetical protein